MTTNELRELTPEQLLVQVQELVVALTDVRAAVAAGNEKNHGRIKVLRRDVARAQTIWRAQHTH